MFTGDKRETLSQAGDSDITPPSKDYKDSLPPGTWNVQHSRRDLVLVASKGVALVCCVLFIYLSPRVPELLHESVR